jgi:ribosomal protein L28
VFEKFCLKSFWVTNLEKKKPLHMSSQVLRII